LKNHFVNFKILGFRRHTHSL